MAVYLICYLASYILARFGHYLISGLLLLAAAGWLYMEDYRKYKNLIHLRGLFSLFWVGGEGLACRKLSSLQTDWSNMTWFCLFLAYIGFWLVSKFWSACTVPVTTAMVGGEAFPGDSRPVLP